MFETENSVTIINILITALIAIVSSLITSHYATKPEKQITSRLIFDKCYSKIYSVVEYDLHSKDITLEKARYYGNEIVKICDQSNYYFYPSVKIYAERLVKSNKANYQENWDYFSMRFSLRYDTVCKDIGLPLRNHAYRLNRGQYRDNWDFFRLMISNDWPSVLFIILGLLVFLFLKVNS